MGVVGTAPEVSVHDRGPITRITVCVDEWYSDSITHETKKITTWYRCTGFNKLGEHLAKQMRVGSWVYIEGRMHCKKMEDKREFWSLVVDLFRDVTGKKLPSERNAR